MSQAATIGTLLEQEPHQHLAFVRSAFKPEELAETLAALANSQGGTVIIGINQRKGRGKTSSDGLPNVANAQTAVMDAALLCTPPLLIPIPTPVQHDGLNLLMLNVPAGMPHVYSVHGKYLRREGDQDQPIPPDALRRLLIERGETNWERLRPAEAMSTDLDLF
jgi:ATP-dependent DNA helicase RecG